MRRLILLFQAATLPALLVVAPRADAASIQYSATDLGAGFTLQTNPDGSTYGVSNASGTTAYAFDKVPVTPINVRQNDEFNSDRYSIMTMQVGSHQAGFIHDNVAFSEGGGISGFAPTTEGVASGWYIKVEYAQYPSPNFRSPVLDVNNQGQIVGVSDIYQAQGTYAAFTGINGLPHGWNATVSDNLNNYIATIPGVSLTSAFKIDDLGRILALGSDNHDYLLTPTSLGGVEFVPEPTTLATLGALCLLLGHRIRCRGKQRA